MLSAKNHLVVDFGVLPVRRKLNVVQRLVQKGLGIASADLKSIRSQKPPSRLKRKTTKTQSSNAERAEGHYERKQLDNQIVQRRIRFQPLELAYNECWSTTRCLQSGSIRARDLTPRTLLNSELESRSFFRNRLMCMCYVSDL